MKKLLPMILLIPLCLIALSVSSAQIPNPGFETWTAGAPTGWYTNNIASLILPITQSSDAHAGSSSMQGTVASYLTVPYTPIAFTSFSINTRYGSLKGYYKYSPKSGDSLEIFVDLFKSGSPIAFGYFATAGSASSYTEFTAPIMYGTSDVPDSAWIEILIIPPASSADPHIGSTFNLDDLTFGAATNVGESFSVSPVVFALSQNYPNPFNPSTKISYQLPTDGMVRLEVYNILGKTLATLVNEEKSAGKYTATFDGSAFTSGIYLYRLNVISHTGKSFSQTNKMILMK
jgi:hypothetical protein